VSCLTQTHSRHPHYISRMATKSAPPPEGSTSASGAPHLMNLNNLFTRDGIDPQKVLVFRHCPHEPGLRKVLPWLAAEKPDTFNAYQQTQGRRLEKAMKRAGYVASFIGHEPGKALFVGLYSRGASKPLTVDEFWNVPAHVEMKAFGMRGFTGGDGRSSILRFDLKLIGFCASWKGKLVVGWPPPERSWWRRAHRNDMPVLAVLEDSALDAAMPEWDEMMLTYEELRVLPTPWRSALSHWRGIYYISDASDGKAYVGSAYGNDNIFGRWKAYADSGHGGNRLLRQRNKDDFRFTILQRVSPDMDAADVIHLENTWKERLHTRAPNGLNDN